MPNSFIKTPLIGSDIFIRGAISGNILCGDSFFFLSNFWIPASIKDVKRAVGHNIIQQWQTRWKIINRKISIK